MNNLVLIGPELFLAAIALVVILGEAFCSGRFKAAYPISIVSLLLVAAYYGAFFCQHTLLGVNVAPVEAQGGMISYPTVLNMIAVDSFAIFFKFALVCAVLIVLWLSTNYREFVDIPLGTYNALLLLATVGMMLLVGSVDFLMAVIALELVSVTSFILTGFVYHRRSSSEGAIKFFLVGSLSAAILLFGISYYYGYFGTTHIAGLVDLAGNPDFAISAIVVFIVAGLGFKLAMAPFHMWAPDAYEGAPTPVTAFLSVAPKAAAIGFVLRVFSHHAALQFTPVLAVLAAITMTVGNVGALQQSNVKRLLAYSSIAQIGYILVALVGAGPLGFQAAMIYTFVYLFMNLGVFAIFSIVSNGSGSDDITTFAGLSRRSFGLALMMCVFLLSMSGIPPMAGFVGKFAIFASVIRQPNLLWLAIVAVINSVISLYYYFRIVQQMFFKEPGDAKIQLSLSPALISCLVVTLGVTVLAGILPEHLLGWVRNLVGS